MNKSEELEIEEDDAVIVVKPDHRVEFGIPHQDPDAIVPQHAILVIAIATRIIHDSEFVDGVLDWFDQDVQRMFKEESEEAKDEND